MEDDRQPQSAVTWVRKNSRHTGSMRTVLIMLADFIDDGNNCPSQKELAAAAGLSTDTVRRVLGELVKDRTIIITKAGGKKVRGGQRDCYAVNRRDTPATTPHPTTGLQQPPRTQQPGRPIPGGMEQPGSIPEDAPVYVRDAAGEKAKEKEKTTTTTVLPAPKIEPLPDTVDSGGSELQLSIYAPEPDKAGAALTAPPDKPLQEMDNDLGRVAKCYEDNIAPLVEMMRLKLITAVDTYTAAWIVEAIGIAVDQNKRTWAYVNGILRRWKQEGKTGALPTTTPKPKPSHRVTPEELHAARLAQSDGFMFSLPDSATS